MKRDVTSLQRELYDVVIIGGGISGACLAHDLSLRGRKIALLEQADFGGFTSAASSRLVHGGIRYLPKIHLHKVRESARERAILQNLAPHLTRWVPFVIPTSTNDPFKGRAALGAGMMLYDFITGGVNRQVRDPAKKVPTSRFYSRHDLMGLVPQLAHLKNCTGAWVMYESHMHSSERMTLAFVKTAVRNGAHAANYLRVVDVIKQDRRVQGVVVRDRIGGGTFRIRAKVTVNAAGPFIPDLNKGFGNLRLRKPLSGFAKGVHLITRQIHPTHAMALTTEKKTEGYITRGGRHVFIIPWRDCSLIGTTNTPFHASPHRVRVVADDVLDFLRDINRILPDAQLALSDVRHAFTGLYPLTAAVIKPDTYQGTGDYQVVDHARRDGVEGIVTVLGAKFTTARKLAQIAADGVERLLGGRGTCRTDRVLLTGGDISDWERFSKDKCLAYAPLLSSDQIRRLIAAYGSEVDRFLDYASTQPEGTRRISDSSDVLCAQVRYAVEHEMAKTLADVVFRRTDLGMFGHPGEAALKVSATIMAGLLNWHPEKTDAELKQVVSRYDYPDVDSIR